MAHTVFISSTRKDLLPYVEAVDLALRRRRRKFEAIRNEYWGARDQDAVEACVQEVAEADLFVGIYGWRYGYVPPGTEISITEQELLAAEALEKPTFLFMVKDGTAPPEGLPQEAQGAESRLAQLKARLNEHVVDWFTDPNDLALKVVTALDEWEDRQAPPSEERRLLLELWETVHRSWIEGVLRRSVPEGRRLRLAWEERPEKVGQPALAQGGGAAPALPVHTLFTRRSRKLLILGAPGAGKTMTLLELARERGRLARASAESIPVVFHLGSWSGGNDLAAWMTDQLVAQYRVQKADARAWIKADRGILPLLDALDEVEADSRPGCVKAINTYLAGRGQRSEMAVCCSTEVYEDLFQRLKLESAIELLPLAPAQVEEHLAAGGSGREELRAAIAGSPELRELVTSPLMLSLAERGGLPAGAEAGAEAVFAGYVAHVLDPEADLPWAVEEPTPSVFDRLLPWRRYRPRRSGRSLARRRRYPPERSRTSLAWLARQMDAHQAPLFQVERLQPAWLGGGATVWAYLLLSRALGGALLALPLAWAYGSVALLLVGVLAGALAGGVDALWMRGGAAVRDRPRWWRRLGRGVLTAGAVMLLLVIATPLWLRLFPSGLDVAGDARNLLRAGLPFALLFGLVFGTRAAARGRNHDVRVKAALVWKGWSWRFARLAGVCSALPGLGFAWLGFSDRTLRYIPRPLWLAVPAAFLLAGGLLGGILGGLGGKSLERKVWPNQGIWRTLGNAALVALCAGLPAAAVLFLYLATTRGALRWRDVFEALTGGVTVGMWAGLWYSGLDAVQHFTLRALLRLRRRVPARLVRFLNYATERGLLQRAGGSYQFYHRRLLQHLARSAEAVAATEA